MSAKVVRPRDLSLPGRGSGSLRQLVRENEPPHKGGEGWAPVPRVPPSMKFLKRCADAGGRNVEWPPRFGSVPEGLNKSSRNNSMNGLNQPNQTTVYPSIFKMRNQAPVDQAPPPVYACQPVFNVNRPMRVKGDAKWPPKGAEQDDQPQVQSWVKPKKQNKDYSKFFSKNALPDSYTGYRAPPGTQHVGAEEEDGTDM